MIKLIDKRVNDDIQSFIPMIYKIEINDRLITVKTCLDEDYALDWYIEGGNKDLTEEEYDSLIDFMTTYQQ